MKYLCKYNSSFPCDFITSHWAPPLFGSSAVRKKHCVNLLYFLGCYTISSLTVKNIYLLCGLKINLRLNQNVSKDLVHGI